VQRERGESRGEGLLLAFCPFLPTWNFPPSVTAMTNDLHVYPIDDLRPHNTNSRDCACRPKVEIDQSDGFDVVMVVHNAFDFRENFESSNSELSQ